MGQHLGTWLHAAMPLELWGSDPESNSRCVAAGRPAPARPSSQRAWTRGLPSVQACSLGVRGVLAGRPACIKHWSSGAVTQSPTPGASLWGARFRQGPAARGLDQGASQCASLLLRANRSFDRDSSMHQALKLWAGDSHYARTARLPRRARTSECKAGVLEQGALKL